MTKPVVLIAEELSPATVEALGPDFEIRHCDGADRARCWPRSPTSTRSSSARRPRSTPRRSPPPAACRSSPAPASASTTSTSRPPPRPASWSSTRRRPTSCRPPSSRSACCSPRARNIPQADAALKDGEWKRSKYTGVESDRKTVGVVGLGRIGVLVAQRLSAFGMTSSPTTRTCSRPAPPSSASAWSRSTSCSRSATSSPCTCRRRRRRSA